MGLLFVMGIPYVCYLGYLVVTTILSISRGDRKCRTAVGDSILYFSEIIFTLIAPLIGFLRFDTYGGTEIPFAKHYVFIIILLTLTSSASFWLARVTANTTNLFVRIILSAGMLQGMLLCAIVTVHFGTFMLMGMALPIFGFELMAPPIAFLLLLREFYFYNKAQPDFDELLPYRKELGLEPVPYKIIQLPVLARLMVYFSFVLAFVAIQMALCYALGMAPDSIIKVFTQSKGFVFSCYTFTPY